MIVMNGVASATVIFDTRLYKSFCCVRRDTFMSFKGYFTQNLETQGEPSGFAMLVIFFKSADDCDQRAWKEGALWKNKLASNLNARGKSSKYLTGIPPSRSRNMAQPADCWASHLPFR